MFRAVGVLVIFTVQKSLVNCFPDLTPEAITVYRNPEFFKNLYYGNYDKYETATETSRGEETEDNYKYPGETTKPNKPPPDSPGFGVTYDNSPEFHHDPRDVAQTPFKPPKRKGPYSPLYDGDGGNEDNAESNNEENTADNSGENSGRSSDENSKENTEDSENNFQENSQENSESNVEENTEATSEHSNESDNINSSNNEDASEENAEESSRNSEEEERANGSSEEETEDNKGETREKHDEHSGSENSEENQARSPPSLVTPDEALEPEEQPTPPGISDLSKSLYSQPYPLNASRPILYDNWKHYNYPKISSLNFKNAKVTLPYSTEPSSYTFYNRHDDDEEEEGGDSFENLDTGNMGTDTKRIYKKLLRHKKLKPSLLFKYHSKPKLKKLKLKVKKGAHNHDSWFDLHPFDF